ncbi:protein of unknown function [Enterobacter cancerogenus]|nr:protein of unknown function [Enterobacter cancerogenus]
MLIRRVASPRVITLILDVSPLKVVNNTAASRPIHAMLRTGWRLTNCIISCMGGNNSRLSDKKTRTGVYLCVVANTASDNKLIDFLRHATKKKPQNDPRSALPLSFL